MLPVRSVLVVFSALLRIAQDLVGLVDLLELFLSRLLVLCQVGVMLSGKFAEGAFDLVSRGCLGDAQGLVVLAELCGHDVLLLI